MDDVEFNCHLLPNLSDQVFSRKQLGGETERILGTNKFLYDKISWVSMKNKTGFFNFQNLILNKSLR